jgi:hypothetical protein
MRLLFVLLALISGLSLSEVTASAARAEVVGAASGTMLVASQERKASTGLAKTQRPTSQTRIARVMPLPAAAPVRAISISIPDRPRE